ncbi:WD40-repeat-containing domain protein [Thamnocephalis sphaerospora]|uniref:WD40-repeat-containing domain protein n=1 Tax=Thamnocephalis sphaerospora TaxID=78915 RepID=A0A4V1IVL6_9FUNG|nr:WD40-repeat-containing domain protein [Thamnocephalis sphaerospora]|eukprot:RKP04489.1 WD40-repeat-containing domain protein [Thamnocephalis sphaerospora]
MPTTTRSVKPPRKKEAKKQKAAAAKAIRGGETGQAQKTANTLGKLTGGRASQQPVEFTHDSRYFLSGVGNEVKLYSIATGDVARTLPAHGQEGHNMAVTAIAAHPTEHNQVFTGSVDGHIIVWDYSTATQINNIVVGEPIAQIAVCAARRDIVLVLTASRRSGKSTLYKLQLSGDTPEPLQQIAQITGCQRMAWAPDGEFVALLAEREMYVGRLANDSELQLQRFTLKTRASCIAFHATEACIAVGDIAGRITLWYCLGATTNEETTRTMMHWHAHGVNALTFTTDGIYMLSGGPEGVLVLWHMRSGGKQFLPHLGAEILAVSVSPDQAYYALTHADNTIRVVNALDLTLRQVVQGLKLQVPTGGYKGALPAGLTTEPRSRNLVLNGAPGSLQFYNPFSSRHILDLELDGYR